MWEICSCPDYFFHQHSFSIILSSMILRIFLFSLTFKYQILFLVHTTVASLYLGNVYKGHGVKLILFGQTSWTYLLMIHILYLLFSWWWSSVELVRSQTWWRTPRGTSWRRTGLPTSPERSSEWAPSLLLSSPLSSSSLLSYSYSYPVSLSLSSSGSGPPTCPPRHPPRHQRPERPVDWECWSQTRWAATRVFPCVC